MSHRDLVPSDDGIGLNVGIVASRWNEAVVRRLLAGALATLHAHGVAVDDVTVTWVPGSYELPHAAQLIASRSHAVIALGCVIRGETEHFRLVADAASQGLMSVMLDERTPVVNGVLAVESLAQAEARSGGEHGNTGSQVALAAIRMANLHRERWAT